MAIVKFNTSGSTSTPESGSGNGLLWVVGLGLLALGVWYFGFRKKEDPSKASTEKSKEDEIKK